MASSPVVIRNLNLFFLVFWIVMVPISFVTGWINSVAYVSLLSLWALIASHLSAWDSARVEVRQEEIAAEDTAQQVTDRIVEQTEISKVETTETETTVSPQESEQQ